MKKLMIALFSMSAIFPILTASATETDADGYPILYLRGSDCGGWAALESNRFTRNGNTYSIKPGKLSGEFKISDDDWSVNFGAMGEAALTPGAYPVKVYSNGTNLTCNSAAEDLTLTLEYNPANPQEALLWCTPEGVSPQQPTAWSGTLPVLYINVYGADGEFDNEIIDKDLDHKNYFSGEYWLDLNGCEWMEAEGAKSIGSPEEPLPLEIKARGNWTRIGFSKKPFKLKLGSKQSMLGLSKSKHFAILAHADDNAGYLRNFTGFNLGRRMGLPWTPSQQPVEVVINGDYRGLYFLTESIRIEKDRIDITELDDNVSDPALISGGYLVELDNYDEPDESQIRMEEKGDYPGFKDMLRVTFDTPEVYSELQRKFITDQFTDINNLVGENSDDLWGYLDLDDAARFYLVNEIVSHVEAFHGSTYLFRDAGADQKWHFSPLWDFGNAFVGPTDGYIYDNAPFGMTWIGSFSLNRKFSDKVRETWKWFMSNKFDGIYDDMQSVCDHLKAAADADHARWAGQPVPDGGAPVADNTDLESKLSYAQSHLRDKITWLTRQFGDFADRIYAEPARDNTPAAPLPAYITAGINEIEKVISNDGVNLYDLQGNAVTYPRRGEIYILITPTGSKKIMTK